MQSPQDSNKPQKSRPPVPETLGATSAPIKVGKAPTTIHFEVHAPTGPALLRTEGPPKRALLRVESVTSGMPAPSINVYINLPSGDEPEKPRDLFALKISTFGLMESSEPSGEHPGNGLSFVQDVTDAYLRLTSNRNWDGKTLRLTFIPGPSADYPVDVKIGRVSLMIE